MKTITLSAFADEYSPEFDVQLSMLCEHGFTHIEPRFLLGKNVAALTEAEAREVKEKLAMAGIRVSAIGSPLGKIKLSDDFAAHLDLTRRVCETANILGTKNVRMFSFYPADGKMIADCRDEVLDKLSQMLDIASEAGVTLCHENEAEIYGESPEACLDLLTALPKLRCVFDMGNFVLGGYNPMDAYKLLRDHIEYFHIKDALYAGAIVPPGRGEAQIGEIIKAFAAEKDVIVTLEPHLETFDGLNSLVGRAFENPYKFESKEIAFVTAIHDLKELIK
ncbi:MAG: sugar phosphate isomerase/epimerase [Ruminococcaceae bacterium]|nr:sugar phosphate isomerase/epimerase [Oscillospiraceae bacterium]